ncbi:MAG: 3-isopropylmalate dehydratase large subunit [Peptococcaceae bacterium]|jgi:3-isopropylmalate/(R)-2-methylmalate dehydratase large subunit|nr:3-isopropylmalate dehydratase large subunit [Peptococcaceae bacterium]
MSRTIAEKILSAKSGLDAKAGDLVLAELDLMMGHDFNAAMTFQVLEEMGATVAAKPERTIIVFDHSVPAPNESYARLHQKVEAAAKRFGVRVYPPCEGICHHLLPERGHVRPGDLIIASDSHTCTYGALGAFATGVGSTDLAVGIMTGKLWFKVPKSIRIHYSGQLPPAVSAKDLALFTIGRLGADGANYLSVEYSGEAIDRLSMDGRLTLCNMSIEMGAKAGLIEPDQKTLDWLAGRVNISQAPARADEGAAYERILDFDVSELRPQIARPHEVDNVCDIDELLGLPIQSAFIGACTNGRMEDLRVAAGILAGKRVHPDVRLYIIPASRRIWLQAAREGLISVLLEAGAILEASSCGPCAGICGGVPGDGQTMLTTANRNFKGRAGNSKSDIYLASPAVVAASAIHGQVTHPGRYLIKA